MHFVTNGPCFRLCRSLLRACGSLILGDCEKKKSKQLSIQGHKYLTINHIHKLKVYVENLITEFLDFLNIEWRWM